MALLRRSTFSPAQPWRAKTRPFPGGDGEQSPSPHFIAKTASSAICDGSGPYPGVALGMAMTMFESPFRQR